LTRISIDPACASAATSKLKAGYAAYVAKQTLDDNPRRRAMIGQA
jgi:hypothetical protein